MKVVILPIIFCFFALNIFAQSNEAQMISAFGKITCGHFMALMDGVLGDFKKFPDSKIYVVYYGARYRRTFVSDNKTKGQDKIKLEYPHREDGLNWAKAIPFYFASENVYPAETRDLIKDKIVLIDGGFREETELEIWLVPKDGELPTPTPTIAERDIIFRKDNPRRTPDFTCCYCGY